MLIGLWGLSKKEENAECTDEKLSLNFASNDTVDCNQHCIVNRVIL